MSAYRRNVRRQLPECSNAMSAAEPVHSRDRVRDSAWMSWKGVLQNSPRSILSGTLLSVSGTILNIDNPTFQSSCQSQDNSVKFSYLISNYVIYFQSCPPFLENWLCNRFESRFDPLSNLLLPLFSANKNRIIWSILWTKEKFPSPV